MMGDVTALRPVASRANGPDGPRSRRRRLVAIATLVGMVAVLLVAIRPFDAPAGGAPIGARTAVGSGNAQGGGASLPPGASGVPGTSRGTVLGPSTSGASRGNGLGLAASGGASCAASEQARATPAGQHPATPSTPGIGGTGPGSLLPAGSTIPDAPARLLEWKDPWLEQRVPILMYHRVSDRVDAGDSLPSLVVDPDLFDRQMAALHAAGWHTVTFRKLALDMVAGRPERPRTFVITFDDGYRDGFLHAAPVLERYGFVATFFVITGRVGDAGYLRAADLCRLTAMGDEIANHTVHHVGLPQVGPARAAAEISGAGASIRGWTGVAPVTMAYPYGSWSAGVADDLLRDGYLAAVTNVEGAYESFATRYVIPRLRVGPGTVPASLLGQLEAIG